MIRTEKQQPQTPKPNNYFTEHQIHLNPHFCPYSVYTGNLLTPNSIPNQLYFSFDIKALTSIRLLGDNNKIILKLTLGDLKLCVKVVKNQDQFIFQEGLYRNYMVAELVYEGFSGNLELGRKEIRYQEWTNLLVTIQKTIEFDQKIKWNLEECYPVIQFGNLNGKLSFQCKIRSVKLTREKQSTILRTQQKVRKQIQFHDGPLDTIPKNDIPSYKNLPEYQSPKSKPDKLYLCHDMAGGYNQDINKNQPYPTQKNKYSTNLNYENTYRCLHLAQASIFNYFSHHLITIPPKHWRRLCRQTKTKCLGTFIVESDKIAEEIYLSPYTIQLLVYFCRFYKFDGYLINLEYKVKNSVKLLMPWLRKLVSQIHIAVPGSQIIWYDSIINNGSVNYQNQINQKNVIFYKICDGMFLNYWWDQNKLQNTLNFRIEDKMIYVGSDCFGRGTFGGGGYNTYKAIQAMKKVDNGLGALAPALFAMGYTYQFDKQNIQSWKINQKCLYRGLYQHKQEIPHSAWEYFKPFINGFKWQFENQWAVTSFQSCRRSISLKLKQLQQKLDQQGSEQLIFTFFTTVAGTGPKFQDIYKISMVVSLDGNILNQCSTGSKQASQKQQIVELKMNIDCDLITQGTIVSIIEQGHDVEKWGGFYGSRFKNDQVRIVGYNRDNDWIARYKTNFPSGIDLPYITFYNLGHGSQFYFKGQIVKKLYDFMSDHDPCYTYIMNPPLNVSAYYNDAYIGGTSLYVQNTLKLKLIQISPKKQRKICCRVVVKYLEHQNQQNHKFKLTYKWGKETGQGKLSGQDINKNSWITYQFQINLPQVNQSTQNDKLILYLQASNKDKKYLLGQTAVYPKQSKPILPAIQQLTIKISEHNPPISPIFFDCVIKMSDPCRILVIFGEQYSCFGWADNLNNNRITIQNIYGPPHKKTELQIHILDGEQSFKSIYSNTVDTKILVSQGQLVLI